MNSQEANDLLERMSAITAHGLPIADGLRAVAAESSATRVRSSLLAVADAVDSGSSLPQAVQRLQPGLPTFVVQTLAAGTQHDRVAGLLHEFLRTSRLRKESQRSMRQALMYPAILVLLTLVISLLLALFVLPELVKGTVEMEAELARPTQMLIQLVQQAQRHKSALLIGLPSVLIGSWLIWKCLRRPLRNRMLATMPVFGCITRWWEVATWCGLLRTALITRMPLPEALDCVSQAMSDSCMGAISATAAERNRRGVSLADSLQADPFFPSTVLLLIRWGEANHALADSLDAASQQLLAQLRLRSRLLVRILPPVVFLFCAFVITGLGIVMIEPLVSLISLISS